MTGAEPTPAEMAHAVADAIEAILDDRIRTKHPDTREPWWVGRVRFQRTYAQRLRDGDIADWKVREMHGAMVANRAPRRHHPPGG